MPYKDKKKQAEYLKKYRKSYMTPYMRRYRKFKSEQQKKLHDAVRKGNLDGAKKILKIKPSINVFGKPKKGKKRSKAKK